MTLQRFLRWLRRWAHRNRNFLVVIASICSLAWLVGDRSRWWLPLTAAILFTFTSIDIVQNWKTK